MAEDYTREIASQLQKSSSLVLQNEQLLTALREVTAAPDFNPKKHPTVMDLLSKVCTSLLLTGKRPRILANIRAVPGAGRCRQR